MSHDDLRKQIDSVATARGFSCKQISWEDATRGTTSGGGLSVWGANISDVRLTDAKTKKPLWVCRSQNFNERLGDVKAGAVAVVVRDGGTNAGVLKSITLKDYLANVGEYAAYTGIKTSNLLKTLDDCISIRFQTAFLPIASHVDHPEFFTEVYNYQTRADSDPANYLLLCTAQGVFLQQSTSGSTPVLLHEADPSTGNVSRFYLEAEKSTHKVGGEQKETAEEAAEAASRGKATAQFIGTEAMGQRFNVQMLIQVPIEKKVTGTRGMCLISDSDLLSTGGSGFPEGACFGGSGPQMYAACTPPSFGGGGPQPMGGLHWSQQYPACASVSNGKSLSVKDTKLSDFNTGFVEICDGMEAVAAEAKTKSKTKSKTRDKDNEKRQIGVSNAARVSRGSLCDTKPKHRFLGNPDARRHPEQHITITVTNYYTCQDGVPSPADVTRAMDDIDELFKSCSSQGSLASMGQFTAPMDVVTTNEIQNKVKTDPYKPPVLQAFGSSSFPK